MHAIYRIPRLGQLPKVCGCWFCYANALLCFCRDVWPNYLAIFLAGIFVERKTKLFVESF